MIPRDNFAPADNPFSARHVRPGAIPFRFLSGESAETLVGKLQQAGWRGQIVGPHGSGKSTLLAALLPVIREAGIDAVHVELHDGQRTLPIELKRAHPRSPAMIVVDGYEQLCLLSRIRLLGYCRYRRLGLLVTTHRAVRLPVLIETRMEGDLAKQIVQELLGAEAGLVDQEELARRLDLHGGNLREVLFDLYDLYEYRRMQRG